MRVEQLPSDLGEGVEDDLVLATGVRSHRATSSLRCDPRAQALGAGLRALEVKIKRSQRSSDTRSHQRTLREWPVARRDRAPTGFEADNAALDFSARLRAPPKRPGAPRLARPARCERSTGRRDHSGGSLGERPPPRSVALSSADATGSTRSTAPPPVPAPGTAGRPKSRIPAWDSPPDRPVCRAKPPPRAECAWWSAAQPGRREPPRATSPARGRAHRPATARASERSGDPRDSIGAGTIAPGRPVSAPIPLP